MNRLGLYYRGTQSLFLAETFPIDGSPQEYSTVPFLCKKNPFGGAPQGHRTSFWRNKIRLAGILESRVPRFGQAIPRGHSFSFWRRHFDWRGSSRSFWPIYIR